MKTVQRHSSELAATRSAVRNQEKSNHSYTKKPPHQLMRIHRVSDNEPGISECDSTNAPLNDNLEETIRRTLLSHSRKSICNTLSSRSPLNGLNGVTEDARTEMLVDFIMKSLKSKK